MKQAAFLLAALAFCIGCTAQTLPSQAEVADMPNECGKYLYPDSTIGQLRHIVDSLNLRYKSCDKDRICLSKWQGRAHYVSLEKGNIKQAKKDLEGGMSLGVFLKKYPAAKLQKNLLVVLAQNRKGNDSAVFFETVALDEQYEHWFKMDRTVYMAQQSLQGKWVLDYTPKSEYDGASLEALFFTADLAQRALPEKYSQLIAYADCMVDTTAQVYLSDKDGSFAYYERDTTAIDSILHYLQLSLNEPVYEDTAFDEVRYGQYRQAHDLWVKNQKFKKADSLFAHDAKCQTMFERALATALEKGGSDDAFEELVERYDGPAKALLLKRKRRVVGRCSMDNSPIMHATHIARLSAAAVNWEVFLRSHLNILNDRFDRVTDGSYAWAGRGTYLPELEALHINVLDLLLGISLHFDNASDNHYWGSIRRVGRALSETNQPQETETALLAAIGDKGLDDYNRVLFYYIYVNYIYHKLGEEKKVIAQKLDAAAVNKLPAYIAATGR
jgi:hypothetical protein